MSTSGFPPTAPGWDGGVDPGLTMLLILPSALAVTVFALYCVADVLRARSVRHLPKWLWIVVCVLWPLFGGIAYLYLGKEPIT